MYRHLTVQGLSLNHSFTLEFFVKSYCNEFGVGSLFANYRSPYVNVGGSLYNFKIRKGSLAFTEEPSDVSLPNILDSTSTALEAETWAHLAITVKFDDRSDVTFYRNGACLLECPDVVLLVADNPNLEHYVGGVRHDW